MSELSKKEFAQSELGTEKVNRKLENIVIHRYFLLLPHSLNFQGFLYFVLQCCSVGRHDSDMRMQALQI